MLRALLQTRSQLAAGAGRTAAARMLSSAAESQGPPAKSSSLRNFFLALVPIGVMGAVFEKKHLDSMAETEAREAAERAAGHTPPPRATASGGVTSHGVAIDPDNPLNKMLPDTDCEYCLETRQKIYDMFKHMGHKEGKAAKPKAVAGPTEKAAGAPASQTVAAPAPKPAAAAEPAAAHEAVSVPKPAAAAAEAPAAAGGSGSVGAPEAAAAPVAATTGEAAEVPAAAGAAGAAAAAAAPPGAAAAAVQPAPAVVEAAAPGPQL